MKHILGLVCVLGIAGTAAAQDVRAPIRQDLASPRRMVDTDLSDMQTRSLSFAEKKSFVSASLKINLNDTALDTPFDVDLREMEFKKQGKAAITFNTKGSGDLQIYQTGSVMPYVLITGGTEVWFDLTNHDFDRWLVTVHLRGQGANPLSFKYTTGEGQRTDVLPVSSSTVYNFVIEEAPGPNRLSIINETDGAYYLDKFEVTPID